MARAVGSPKDRMSQTIQYEELALAIEPVPDGGYNVRPLRSPYWPAAAPSVLAPRREDLEEMVREVGAAVRLSASASPPRDLSPMERRPPPEATLGEAGSRLFRFLFDGALHDSYMQSRGRIDAAAGRGLRIRVVLPSAEGDAGLLHALPWELLRSPETGEFLACNPLTPVVRGLPLPGISPPFPEAATDGLRILIVVAQPEGTALDDADERARILAVWLRQQRAEVRVLADATAGALYEELRAGPCHVVHFIAHGGFAPATGEGSLLLHAAHGGTQLVPGAVLAETLRANRELRLVFLNACSTAQSGHRPGQQPLLAAAAALVRSGVPAVLAMQFPITDTAAREFSEAVYLSLARGSSLEAAATDGRIALRHANPRSWQWVTPTLCAAMSEADVFRPLCAATGSGLAAAGDAAVVIRRLLRSRSYAGARQVLEGLLDRGETSADLDYYLALALLGDRWPGSLALGEMRPIEASARRAIEMPGCAAHHLCFLAFLQRAFYLENHLVPRPPDHDELLRQAQSAQRDGDRLDELATLVPEAEPEVAWLGAGIGSKAR